MYLTIPVTGIFAMTAWLPPEAQVVMNWSPLANAVEMFRAGVFPESTKTHWDAWFILNSSLVLFAVGFPLIAVARRRVQAH
jgi:capsular polysaccharide transport system permease protein